MASNLHVFFFSPSGFSGLNFHLQSKGREPEVCSLAPCRNLLCKAKTCSFFSQCGPRLVLQQSSQGLDCRQRPARTVALCVGRAWHVHFQCKFFSSLWGHGVSLPPTCSRTNCTGHLPTGTSHGLSPWHCGASLRLGTRNKISSIGNSRVQ